MNQPNNVSLLWMRLLLLATTLLVAVGFTPPALPMAFSRIARASSATLTPPQTVSTTTTTPFGAPTTTSSSRLYGGGFGGSGGGSAADKKSKKASAGGDSGNSGDAKLKPKQQWDRYLDLKKETKIRVAVRCKTTTTDEGKGEEEEEEWLEVGRVKSKEDKYTELAVVRQRAIIAEHAKRLYPLQISNKKSIEWGYFSDDDDEWKTADKSLLDSDEAASAAETEGVSGLEKVIGFEGRPDPASGFYCVYDEGRLKKE